MTTDQIEKYIEISHRKGSPVHIHFKDRNMVSGIFVQLPDFSELKSKNLWRIVNSKHLNEWKQTKDINLSRIYNGISFTRLSEE